MRKVIIFLLFALPIVGLGKSITLYQKPTTRSKVITSVQTGTPLIKIFEPKNSDWIKVANKKNGDVGWVKKLDIVAKAKSQAITFHKHFDAPKSNEATKVRKVKNHDILV